MMDDKQRAAMDAANPYTDENDYCIHRSVWFLGARWMAKHFDRDAENVALAEAVIELAPGDTYRECPSHLWKAVEDAQRIIAEAKEDTNG